MGPDGKPVMRSWWRHLMDRIAPMLPGDQSRLDLLDRPRPESPPSGWWPPRPIPSSEWISTKPTHAFNGEGNQTYCKVCGYIASVEWHT